MLTPMILAALLPQTPKALPTPPKAGTSGVITLDASDVAPGAMFIVTSDGLLKPVGPKTSIGILVGKDKDGRSVLSRPSDCGPGCNHTPLLVKDIDGNMVFTIADGDEPKGPCNLGDLVRAARAVLDLPASASRRALLRTEVERCEPAKSKP